MEKISSSTWGYRKWNLEDAMASMAKIGYKGVEIVTHHLGTSISYHLTPNMRRTRIEKIKKLTDSLGLKIVCISPGSDFLKPMSGSLKGDIELIKKNIDMALELDCNLVRPLAAWKKPEEVSREDAINVIVKGLKECVKYAEAREVKLALENHGLFDRVPNNLIDIVTKVSSNYLGVCLHTREDFMDILRTIPEKIFHLHLMDFKKLSKDYQTIWNLKSAGLNANRIASKTGFLAEFVKKVLSQGTPVVSLGDGDLDVGTTLKILKEHGYNGWYNYEGHDAENPEEDAKKSYLYLVRCLKRSTKFVMNKHA